MQSPGERPGPPSSEEPPVRPGGATDATVEPDGERGPSPDGGSSAVPGHGRRGGGVGARRGRVREALTGPARPWLVALAFIVLAGFVLRVWGIRWGLPYAYNLDERSHFVPRAVEFFQEGTLDPDYQLNPSGLIEWIAAILWVLKGGGDGVQDAWNDDPASVWTIARVGSALLSTAAIGLIYAAGARLFDRRVGLLAAAILAFAFLPVHYGHLALNDGPSLAATALALFAVAGIVRYGRRRDYVLAGAAIGLGFGVKYNTAFVGLPLLTAAAIHATGWRPGDLRPGHRGAYAPADPRDAPTVRDRAVPADGRPAPTSAGRDRAGRLPALVPALVGLALAAVAGFVLFFLADPYAVLRPGFFRSEFEHLSDYTKGGLLLGETQRSGHRYYAWSLTWGFGVVPLLLCAVGAVRTAMRDRWQFLLLVPAPVIFLLYVGSQGRYFARYGMPVYPVLALLAAAGGVWLATLLFARLRASRPLRLGLAGVGVALVLAQGLVLVVHNDVVLTREDTRSQTRDWMVANIPARTTIVVEPVVPREWYADGAVLKSRYSRAGYRWERLTRTGKDKEALIRKHPRLAGKIRRAADFANHGFTLFPGMLDFYRQKGACWIVSGSLQSGRVLNNPDRVPDAVAYYRALERQADLRYETVPFGEPGGASKHYFQYDMAFNFGQLRYERPGPAMRVYRLRDCTPRVVPEQRDRRG